MRDSAVAAPIQSRVKSLMLHEAVGNEVSSPLVAEDDSPSVITQEPLVPLQCTLSSKYASTGSRRVS